MTPTTFNKIIELSQNVSRWLFFTFILNSHGSGNLHGAEFAVGRKKLNNSEECKKGPRAGESKYFPQAWISMKNG